MQERSYREVHKGEQCNNCRFWRAEFCRRFPETVAKGQSDWCGEWASDRMLEIVIHNSPPWNPPEAPKVVA